MLSSIVWFLVIGIAAGWIAGKIMKGRGFGLVGNLVIGVIGALVGGFLFDVIGLEAYGLLASLVMATTGAVVLLFLLGFVKR
ncbi:MAG: transglycosylase [Gemmatimonas sp. SG8_28]|jgi:uncharacterized membrane protein YeaQ/YmgE (transglycosylase-associated protein family)|nr:MAG: transglycosylase [Gemmatimonas sp. SG8_28]